MSVTALAIADDGKAGELREALARPLPVESAGSDFPSLPRRAAGWGCR